MKTATLKTATLKTLGTAALGAAFAAAAAGTASAAPTLPAADPASALNATTGRLPVGQVANLAPGTAQAAGALRGALHSTPADLGAGGGLLGGLPVNGLGGLPLAG